MKKNKENRFLFQVTTLVSGSLIAALINFLVSPVLTRLFLPEDMGLLASYVAVVSIIGVVASGRYDLAIVLPDHDSDAVSVALAGLIVSFLFSGLVFIVFIFGQNKLVPLLGLYGINHIWFFLIPLAVFMIGVEQILIRISIRIQKFKNMAQAQILQQASDNFIKVSSGLLSFGTSGLYLGTLVGHFCKMCILFFKSQSFIFRNWGYTNKAKILEQASRYKKFPLIASWSGLLNTASTQLPVVLFSSFFSAEVAGYFALGHRVLSLPIVLISTNVGQVFLERASKARNDKKELSEITFRIYKNLLIIGLIGMSVVSFWGNVIFPFIFGNQWTEAGRYAQFMSLWLIFVFASSPLSQLFSVLEKQGEGFIWNMVMLFSRVGIILIGALAQFPPIITVLHFSLIGLVIWAAQSLRVLKLSGIKYSVGILQTLKCIGIIYIPHYLIYLIVR